MVPTDDQVLDPLEEQDRIEAEGIDTEEPTPEVNEDTIATQADLDPELEKELAKVTEGQEDTATAPVKLRISEDMLNKELTADDLYDEGQI